TQHEEDADEKISREEPACEKRGDENSQCSHPMDERVGKGAKSEAQDHDPDDQQDVGDHGEGILLDSRNRSSWPMSKSGSTLPSISRVGVRLWPEIFRMCSKAVESWRTSIFSKS